MFILGTCTDEDSEDSQHSEAVPDSVVDPDYVPSDNDTVDSMMSDDFVACSVNEDSNVSIEIPLAKFHKRNVVDEVVDPAPKQARNDVASLHSSNTLASQVQFDVCSSSSQFGSSTGPEMSATSGEFVNDSAAAASIDSKITVASTCNFGGRKYDKKAYCFVCGTGQSKIARHLRSVHADDDMVQQYVTASDANEKANCLLKMRNLGNHYHNCRVLQKNKGEFIVAYRPTLEVDYTQYKRCIYCYGYFAKQSLWKHGCPFAPSTSDNTKSKHVRKTSSVESHVSTDLGGLLTGMRNDVIGQVVRRDVLILNLGQHLLSKHAADKEQFNYIRGKMRYLGRLLLQLRSISGHPGDMSDFIHHPTRFKIIVQAAQSCAGFDEHHHEFHTPSQAILCGQLVKKVAELKEAKALEIGDVTTAQSCVQFAKLCQLKWSEVSSVARRDL